MLNYLLEGIIAGVLLLAIFEISERIRIAVGKEILTDKMLAFLEEVYQRTAPNDHKEMNWRGCDLPDNVKVIYFNDEKKQMNLYDDHFSELDQLKLNIKTSVGEANPTEVENWVPTYRSGCVQESDKGGR